MAEPEIVSRFDVGKAAAAVFLGEAIAVLGKTGGVKLWSIDGKPIDSLSSPACDSALSLHRLSPTALLVHCQIGPAFQVDRVELAGSVVSQAVDLHCVLQATTLDSAGVVLSGCYFRTVADLGKLDIRSCIVEPGTAHRLVWLDAVAAAQFGGRTIWNTGSSVFIGRLTADGKLQPERSFGDTRSDILWYRCQQDTFLWSSPTLLSSEKERDLHPWKEPIDVLATSSVLVFGGGVGRTIECVDPRDGSRTELRVHSGRETLALDCARTTHGEMLLSLGNDHSLCVWKL